MINDDFLLYYYNDVQQKLLHKLELYSLPLTPYAALPLPAPCPTRPAPITRTFSPDLASPDPPAASFNVNLPHHHLAQFNLQFL